MTTTKTNTPANEEAMPTSSTEGDCSPPSTPKASPKQKQQHSDYAKSKVYAEVSKYPDKYLPYIGSTADTLGIRHSKHKTASTKWYYEKPNPNNPLEPSKRKHKRGGFCRFLFENGGSSIVKLKSFVLETKEQLEIEEQRYIDIVMCRNKNSLGQARMIRLIQTGDYRLPDYDIKTKLKQARKYKKTDPIGYKIVKSKLLTVERLRPIQEEYDDRMKERTEEELLNSVAEFLFDKENRDLILKNNE